MRGKVGGRWHWQGHGPIWQGHGELVHMVVAINRVAAALGRAGMEIVEVNQHRSRGETPAEPAADSCISRSEPPEALAEEDPLPPPPK